MQLKADEIDNALLKLKVKMKLRHIEYMLRHSDEDTIKTALIQSMFYLGTQHRNYSNPFRFGTVLPPVPHIYASELGDSFELGTIAGSDSTPVKSKHSIN
jgi:hypothetical protein